jgi:hypothetical protein
VEPKSKSSLSSGEAGSAACCCCWWGWEADSTDGRKDETVEAGEVTETLLLPLTGPIESRDPLFDDENAVPDVAME